MKRRILLAGGGQTEVPELGRHLTQSVPDWEWVCVSDALHALDELTRRSFHAVVADQRLSDLTGLQLLAQAQEQWPAMHRVILADLGDLTTLLRCVGGPHQFLIRPCEASRLHVVLLRAFTLNLWLAHDTARSLLGRLPNLPSPAAEYQAAVDAVESGQIDAVARQACLDPALAAKVLQLANGAAYGPVLDESDPANAVRELGLSNLRQLLLLAHSGSACREMTADNVSPEEFEQQARDTAHLAEAVATAAGMPAPLCRQSATAGLLHHIGLYALALNLNESFREATERSRRLDIPLWEAEQAVLGTHHGEVGGSLLGLWGLPLPVVEAVALHHHPACLLSVGFSPLTAVHIASTVLGCTHKEEAELRLDWPYLNQLGLGRDLPRWWELRTQVRPIEA